MLSFDEIERASFPDPFSKEFQRIDHETFKKIFDGYNGSDKFVIVDCRTEREFNGGHIKGAVNYHPDYANYPELYGKTYSPDTLYIFHCEFSQYRGPKGIRLIKRLHKESANHEKPINAFVLDGGYSAFWPDNRSYCDGGYRSEMDF